MKLSEVLWYTQQHGYKHPLPVLPLVPRDKIPPSGTHGYKSATLNAETIRNWWCDNQDYNLGVGTGRQGGIVVIDIDQKPDGGKFGEENLEALEDELGELPETWEVLSGGGGRHLYYRYPDGVDDIPSTIGVIAPNIDVKADRGYAVLPPSIHGTTGRTYTWEMSLHPEDTPIADLPQAWIDTLTGKRKTWFQQQRKQESDQKADEQGIPRGRFVLPDKIYKGERNDVLFRYARSLYAKGKDKDEVIRMLNEANAEKCETPLSEPEIRAINKSAKKYQDKNNSIIFHSFSKGDNTTPDTKKQVSEVTKNEVSEVPPEEDPKGDYEIMEPDSSLDPNIDPFLPDISRFHKYDKKGEVPVGVYDERIVKDVMETEHFYFLGVGESAMPFFYQGGAYNSYAGGALLAEAVEKRIYEDLRTAPTISRIMRRFTQKTGCLKRTDDLDRQPSHWVCFRNGYYDPKTKEMHDHDPSLLTSCVIPFDYDPTEKTECKEIDDWLDFAFPDPKAKECVLQYLGYCLTWDTSLKKFLWLTGTHDSGKSMIGEIAAMLAGEENRGTISLEDLTTNDSSSRFSKMELYGKLVCPISEPNNQPLENMGLLKRITGGDKISAERKGFDRISFFCKAKFIISGNSLLRICGESTDAFYTRVLFIKMNNRPEKLIKEFHLKVIKPNIKHLYHLCMEALGRMYANDGFTVPETSQDEMEGLYTANDPVENWLKNRTFKDETNKERLKVSVAYQDYLLFCDQERLRKEDILPKPRWTQSLRDKGLDIRMYHGILCLPSGYTLKTEE